MVENMIFWAGGVLLFFAATLFFHLFPRTIASAAVFALFLGRTDLGGQIGVFSLETGQGDMTVLFLLLIGMFFFLFLVGLALDVTECKPRWHSFVTRIRSSFAR
jgi:hypothetical protein